MRGVTPLTAFRYISARFPYVDILPPIVISRSRCVAAAAPQFADAVREKRPDFCRFARKPSPGNRRWAVADVTYTMQWYAPGREGRPRRARVESHSNTIIIDCDRGIIERFDPQRPPTEIDRDVDTEITALLCGPKSLWAGYEYVTSTAVAGGRSYIMPQDRECSPTKDLNCGYWCLYYVEGRLGSGRSRTDLLSWLSDLSPQSLATLITLYIAAVDDALDKMD